MSMVRNDDSDRGSSRKVREEEEFHGIKSTGTRGMMTQCLQLGGGGDTRL